jgi:hypothetical protein
VSAKVIATGSTVEVLSNGERFDRAWEVHELTPYLIRVSIDGTVDWCDIAEVPKAWVPALIAALRAAGTGEGEREVVGYRVRIKGAQSKYLAAVANSWTTSMQAPMPLTRDKAVRLIREAREWDAIAGSPRWTFHLHPVTRPVRRRGGKR